MKLIIEIPDEVYERAKEALPELCDSVWLGIKNGIPLDELRKILWVNSDYNVNVKKEFVWYWKIKDIFNNLNDYLKGE